MAWCAAAGARAKCHNVRPYDLTTEPSRPVATKPYFILRGTTPLVIFNAMRNVYFTSLRLITLDEKKKNVHMLVDNAKVNRVTRRAMTHPIRK